MVRADRLRTDWMDRTGTDRDHVDLSAPEMVGFREAFSVRDVGVECSNHSTPTSLKSPHSRAFFVLGFGADFFRASGLSRLPNVRPLLLRMVLQPVLTADGRSIWDRTQRKANLINSKVWLKLKNLIDNI
ncbi:hypothetical protein NXC24_CH01035 [Rhizobium sp. NXC24]|nr:hypothetical protein NXC24_CH01035 [Rhizobium sp. NXC24]